MEMMCQCECEKPGNPVSTIVCMGFRILMLRVKLLAGNAHSSMPTQLNFISFRVTLRTPRNAPLMERTCVVYVSVLLTSLAVIANVMQKI